MEVDRLKTDLSRMNQKVLEVDQLKEKLTRMETSIKEVGAFGGEK